MTTTTDNPGDGRNRRRLGRFVVRVAGWWITAFGLIHPTSPIVAAQNFQYFYDETGQLSKVIDSTGTMIEYVYDPVGNMLEVKRSKVAGLAIFNFTPSQGPVGAAVTIQGQGFSAVAGANTVSFNGVPAALSSETRTTLVASVPQGATTGRIAVAVGTATATSSQDFLVIEPPTITSISPSAAVQGQVVPNFIVSGTHLSGSSFSFLPIQNPIAIGTTGASIDPTGTTANLGLIVNPNATGSFTTLATNAAGDSGASSGAANSITIVLSTGDSDQDGLSNRDEGIFGTDPLNPDTDGDGFSDGVEIEGNSDPRDPASRPFDPNKYFGVADSAQFSALNNAVPPANIARYEVSTPPFSAINDAIPPGNIPQYEISTPPFSVNNVAP
ncbi:MAG: IPT/TIG domain-containing protein [Methylococcales bacterium]